MVVGNCVAADAATGQVEYGSTALSRAVQDARTAAKDRGGNYAAGLLEDGTTVIGRSSADLHAEEDVIAQAGDQRISQLFTEREPCGARCAALTQDINVTWSWPWNPPGVRAATNAALREAVQGLFG
jgi:deoxycytidylate deaminase